MSAAQPVFVDDSGRRRVMTRRVGRVVLAAITAYLGLLVLGLARDPRLGPIPLPTFGLPSLGLMSPPAPTVLGTQESRSASGDAAASENPDAGAARIAADRPTSTTLTRRTTPPAGPTSGRATPAAPAGGSVPVSGAAPTPGLPISTPAGTNPPTTTSTTTKPGQGSKPSTTTTTSPTSGSSTTTSSTTTTTTTARPGGPGSGQGQGQGSGSSSGNGPDGNGAPGQVRKTTTTTAG